MFNAACYSFKLIDTCHVCCCNPSTSVVDAFPMFYCPDCSTGLTLNFLCDACQSRIGKLKHVRLRGHVLPETKGKFPFVDEVLQRGNTRWTCSSNNNPTLNTPQFYRPPTPVLYLCLASFLYHYLLLCLFTTVSVSPGLTQWSYTSTALFLRIQILCSSPPSGPTSLLSC
jgi:hypothetical protein